MDVVKRKMKTVVNILFAIECHYANPNKPNKCASKHCNNCAQANDICADCYENELAKIAGHKLARKCHINITDQQILLELINKKLQQDYKVEDH